MTTRTAYVACVALIVMTLAASAVLYPRLPQTVPTHWNIHGEADGFGDKSWGLFLMPMTMALLLGVFLVLPRISPRRFEVEGFLSTWLFVMLTVVGLLAWIHGAMLYALWRGPVDVLRVLTGGLFVFFALCGNVLGRVKRNFWMGVRTPWTLASERVWTDTHRLTARLFVVSGVIGVVAILAGMPGWMSIVWIMVMSLIPVIYSLVHYKRLERRGEV
jgi:uncharacterized membrane protein